MENEIYLKLSKDEIETIKYALNFQNDVYSSNSMNHDGSENENIVCKICCQEDTICRPYVVVGIHDDGRQYLKKRVIVMAEDADSAIDYARERLEKTSEDVFKVNPDDVHEMQDDEFSVEVL